MTAEFELEPDAEPGTLPAATIDELRHSYRVAKDWREAFGEAIKAQAERRGIKPAALRRYIAALEGDSLDDAAAEAADLEALIAGTPG